MLDQLRHPPMVDQPDLDAAAKYIWSVMSGLDLGFSYTARNAPCATSQGTAAGHLDPELAASAVALVVG